ncbi:MAG: DEAD/DEAH box helicase [Deltaproteobacteria bacterium]|nr:DEAD/DEAH box helicase [Deltaproteobacteria bacterium]
MAPAVPEIVADVLTAAEARAMLLDDAHGDFGKIPVARLVDHILAVTEDADWPVRKAALAALSRRYGFAVRDGLAVTRSPARGAVLGEYRTGRAAQGTSKDSARPYVTALVSLAPLRTSCGCSDFLRSSLGLCKHGLVVIEHLARSNALAKADGRRTREPKAPRLSWDPVHPPRASDDRLLRVRYESVAGARSPTGFRGATPDAATLADASKRLRFINRLRRALADGALVGDPAVLRLLDEEHARATRRRAGEAALGRAMKCLASLRRKLYPYQVQGVERFLSRGRLLLADDMGLGKTTQAIAACHALHGAGLARRGILIVPASLKPQWKREWDATTSVSLMRVDGSPEERNRIYADTRSGFLVIGYEQLLRDLEGVRRFAPDIVVLDEAQRIKNWATKSAAYVKSLEAPYRLVLTGTPMENRFDELASIMDFVDDVALEPKWRLAPLHQLDRGDGASGRGGARNLDLLRGRLAGSMLRRVRHDVLSQLPPRTDTRVPVEMTPAQVERHDELLQPIAQIVHRSLRRPLSQPEFLKLMSMLTMQRILCNGVAQADFDDHWPRIQPEARPTPALLEGMFAPKLATLRGLVEQVVLGQRRKTVIFSQWRAMLRLAEWSVRDLLADAGMRAVFFTGAESSRLREHAIVDFHDDPAVTVMFLSDAGGVGLNLQHAASCCINLEVPWNPAVLEQRIGRIYRLGQSKPIDVYNLVSEEGIEARIAMLVAQKKAVFSSLFDGTTDEVRFEGSASFLESVRKIVEPIDVPVGDAETEPEGTAAEVAAEAAETPTAAPAPAPATEVPAEPTEGSPPLTAPRVTRHPDGSLRIDVPPALAGPLAAMLEALAASLRGSAEPPIS